MASYLNFPHTTIQTPYNIYHNTHISRFVNYGSISECEEVIRVMNGCPCGGNNLRVELGRNSTKRSTDQPGVGF